MKKLITIMFALVLGLALTTKAEAFVDDTPAVDNTVSVFVSIAPAIGFFISTPGSASPNEVGFGAIDTTLEVLTVSPQRIQVDYASNFPAWAVQMYSDNTGAGGPLNGLPEVDQFAQSTVFADDDSDSELFFSAGGMIGGDTDNRAGIAWHGEVNEASAQPIDPDVLALTGWTFLADAQEKVHDGIGDPLDPASYNVQGFDFDNNGFARVLQGGTGNAEGTLMQFEIPGSGTGDFPFADGSIAVWIAGGFFGAAPDDYTSAIRFDIVHF